MLDKIKIAFLSSINQVVMFTGRVEAPTEKYNITSNVHDAIIGMYLGKPGIIAAPDGSEFLLELSLLPASREAKQKALDEAQARINQLNQLVGPEPTPCSKEWAEAAWALALAPSDKALFVRIAQARKRGQRVTYQYSRPDQFRVMLSAPPKRSKAATPLIPEEAYDAAPRPVHFNDEVATQQQVGERVMDQVVQWQGGVRSAVTGDGELKPAPVVERVPVVIVYLRGEDNCRVIERSTWDEWIAASTSGESDWREKGIRCFCYIYDILRTEVTAVDFDQTYTRQELENLADL